MSNTSNPHEEQAAQRVWQQSVLRAVIFFAVVGVVVGLTIAGRHVLSEWRTAKEQTLQRSLESVYREEDWEQVETRSRELLEFNAQSAIGWLCLADACRNRGSHEEAAECLLRVPGENRKAIKAWELASEIYFTDLNKPLDGVKVCRDLLGIDPRNSHARRRLIFYYALTLQRDELVEVIRESIDLRCEPPESYVYLMLSDHLTFTNGYTLNTRWMASTPDEELFLVARAVQMSNSLSTLEDSGDEPMEARRQRDQLMLEYLSKFDGNMALLRYFARLYAKEEDVSGVGEILAQVPDDAGDDAVLWRYRGWYHLMTDDVELSRTAYEKSLKLHPLDWQSWHGLAAVARKAGALVDAERFQAIAITGKDLRKELMQIPDANAVSTPMLARIAEYARQCSDKQIADALDARLVLMR